jgi:hypothetical protein
METPIKTDPSQTALGAQATEDRDLLAANGHAAVCEVEIEIARILDEGLDYRMDDLSEATIAQQQRDFESTVAQQKQIEALTTSLQKVGDQLELSKPAPQLVADNQ